MIIRKHYYSMQASAGGKAQPEKSVEILLYEPIGKDFFGDGIGAKDFAEDLKSFGDVKHITLRVNSPGGSIFEGLAIYNALDRHPAEIVGYVDGVAASMASAILMASDKIIMAKNTMLMIHDPHALAIGNSEDMLKMADMLDKTAQSLVSIYQRKCGKTEKEIREKMQAETWFTAAEALAFGLCDEISGAGKIAACFDFSKFHNVPSAILQAVADAGAVVGAREGKSDKEGGTLLAQAADISNTSGDGQADTSTNKKNQKEIKNMNKCSQCGMELLDGAADCACKVRAGAKKEREAEISEILAIAKKHDAYDLAQKCISEGRSKSEFAEVLLKEKFHAKPVDTSSLLGMSNSEKKKYSILRALRAQWQAREFGAVFDGLEKEASDAVAKLVKREPSGFFIPEDMLFFNPQAVMQAGDATKGGFTIGTEVLGGELIAMLRNKMFVGRLNARQLTGLVGNIAIPRVTGGAIAYWLAETGVVTAADQAFGQIALTPHRLVGDTAYTKELLMQSSISVESFIREDLMRVLAIALDLAAINGSGSGQPVGILNTSGIGSVTFGAAATWSKVVDFETQVANSNADDGSLAYLTTPAVRGKWKSITKFANTASPLWEKGSAPDLGEVNGYPAAATRQVPTDRVIFGNWDDLILASWAGIDVVVDPYSLKKSGQIEITITNWADIAVRNAGSFAVSSDSGAQ